MTVPFILNIDKVKSFYSQKKVKQGLGSGDPVTSFDFQIKEQQ